MTNYYIDNEKTKENYTKDFEASSEARHWVINHLDLSLNWKITKILDFDSDFFTSIDEKDFNNNYELLYEFKDLFFQNLLSVEENKKLLKEYIKG